MSKKEIPLSFTHDQKTLLECVDQAEQVWRIWTEKSDEDKNFGDSSLRAITTLACELFRNRRDIKSSYVEPTRQPDLLPGEPS